MFHKQLELKMAALEFDNITYADKNWYAWYYEIASDVNIIKVESEKDESTKDD
tara:strand:- start:859 stop:1017 length:159 start_codon:yes stop_codon:yes gene_type:complete